MDWLTIIPLGIQLLIMLIRTSEKLFPEIGSGPLKKSNVLGIVRMIFMIMSAVSTGGQKASWEAAEEPVSETIDMLVDVLFNSEGE